MILTKPLAFLDTESTGLSICTDRIVSIAIIKYSPGEKPIKFYTLVNPEMPIPPSATEVHKITDEMVKDAPTFLQISASLIRALEGSDIGTYNGNKFDIPLIIEEFLRVNVPFNFKDAVFVDACAIFKKMEPRTLTAAMKFYCNVDFDGAHHAMDDTKATSQVLKAQTEFYPELKDMTVLELSEFCKDEKRKDDVVIDYAGKLSKDADGDYIYTFGKAKGSKIKNDPGFGTWMKKQDFITRETKLRLEEIFTELKIK